MKTRVCLKYFVNNCRFNSKARDNLLKYPFILAHILQFNENVCEIGLSWTFCGLALLEISLHKK